MALKIVVEKIAEGCPGEGYEAGYEVEPDRNGGRTTQHGYYGRTPTAALFRLFQAQAEGAANLARAVTQHAEIMDAITKEIAQRIGDDLLNDLGPRTVYEATGLFGASRIQQVEAERDALMAQIDDLHRCEHGRRIGADCMYCPGGRSVGGMPDAVARSQAPTARQAGTEGS